MLNKSRLAGANYNNFSRKVVKLMKKPKLPQGTGRKNEIEFASSLTPDIGGGRRSRSHQDRFSAGREQTAASSSRRKDGTS